MINRGYDPYNHAGKYWLRSALPFYIGIDFARPRSDRTAAFRTYIEGGKLVVDKISYRDFYKVAEPK